MWADVRYALRMCFQRPGTSAATVMLLAISIAGSVVTFCVADAILWHPVPYRDPDRLVNIHGYHPGQPNQISALSRVLETWPARDQVLSAVHVWSVSSSVIDLDGQVTAAGTARVSPGLITELGVSVLGRDFMAADVGQRVTILSEELARAHFQNLRDALGRFVLVDGDAHTIIGVAPHGFAFPLGARSAWMPTAAGPLPARVRAIARVRHDLTFAQAAELTASTSRGIADRAELRLVPLVSAPASTSQAVLVSLAAALCLLIVGIANASNLVLSETVQRRGEMAVRRAIGASSFILTRQSVIDVTLRSVAAAALALILVQALLDTIAGGVPRILTYQSLRPIALDWRALMFAVAISALTACAVAVAPCVHILRGDVQSALQSAVPQATPRSRMRDGLTVVQLAATLMLLGATGALVNGFVRLMSVNPGYSTEGVTVVMLRLPSWKYPDRASTETGLRSLESGAMSVPGVLATSIADGVPPATSFQAAAEIETADGASLAGSDRPVGFAVVDDRYFATLRIPLLSGTGLTTSPEVPSVVLTKSLADHLWPGRDAIGRRLRLSVEDSWLTVVGVCGDVRLGGFDQPLGTFAAFMNRAASSTPYSFQVLVVRAALPTRSIAEPLQNTVARALPGAAVIRTQSAAELIANERSRVRFVTELMSALGFVAIVVSMIGVFGALWCAVNQRRREIGVRLAVGADPSRVVTMIIVESLRIIAIAVAIGVPFAFVASFAVRPFLFEVSPADPATIGAIVTLLSGSALAAAYLPARYASQIDPVETLRTP
jgi:predicted permease